MALDGTCVGGPYKLNEIPKLPEQYRLIRDTEDFPSGWMYSIYCVWCLGFEDDKLNPDNDGYFCCPIEGTYRWALVQIGCKKKVCRLSDSHFHYCPPDGRFEGVTKRSNRGDATITFVSEKELTDEDRNATDWVLYPQNDNKDAP